MASSSSDADHCHEQSCVAHIDDGALVGTLKLLEESPNVTQPITVNSPVPTPSIYTDGRGEIHNILAGNKRINILYTKRGVMRSGDIHKNTQHDFIVEGQVEVWFLEKDRTTTKKICGAYEYIRVPPLVPHIFHFMQNTTMAEWWEPEPFQAWFYTPYRQLVEQSFTGSVQNGRLVKLVPDEHVGSKWSANLFTTAAGGIALGLVIGIMVGRRK